MAGLVPAIHAFMSQPQDVVPGTRPGMTEDFRSNEPYARALTLPLAAGFSAAAHSIVGA